MAGKHQSSQCQWLDGEDLATVYEVRIVSPIWCLRKLWCDLHKRPGIEGRGEWNQAKCLAPRLALLPQPCGWASLNASLSGSRGRAPTVLEFLFTEWCRWVDCKKPASINLQLTRVSSALYMSFFNHTSLNRTRECVFILIQPPDHNWRACWCWFLAGQLVHPPGATSCFVIFSRHIYAFQLQELK